MKLFFERANQNKINFLNKYHQNCQKVLLENSWLAEDLQKCLDKARKYQIDNNFDNWIKVGGFDNILFTPNGKVHKLVTKLAFKNLLHPFQPFIIGQKIIGPLMALKFNIPLIIYGENQAEYGNQIKENFSFNMNNDFFSVNNEEPGNKEAI